MKYLFLFTVTLLPLWVLGQINQGKVVYATTAQLQIDRSQLDPAMIREIPSTLSNDFELYFNKDFSLYQIAAAAQAEQEEHFPEGPGREGGVRVRFRANAASRYVDRPQGRSLEHTDFLGREFIIEDQLPKYDWKLTGERKTILGLPVEKATFTDTTGQVVAWFTPAIPVSAGPANYHGLPGLILELDAYDGRNHFLAKSFDPAAPVDQSIVEPTKGKRVTAAEMDKIREEKLKELNAGGGGNVIRIIRQ